MQSQNNNDQPGGGPWAKQTSRMPDLEDVVRQLQSRLQQFLSGGGWREKIIIFCLILAGFVAWTSFYTVPSDSVAVIQRFGKYLTEVPPGLHFKLPLGVDTGDACSRQAAIEAGIRVHHPRRHRSLPEPSRRDRKGNRDGDGRPERRAGGVGGSVPHLGSRQVSFSRSASRAKRFATFPNPSCAKWSATGPSTR